ncbi:hypothetical protein [Helicobacter heilmannii]|uniref:hypothetical protein n=1 Tax=Helicobacter heilmannii TaxID=35817 RepID=UPI0006B351B5|nr:hypothetical protein [Helicobacter heilmannii]BDQ27176.1 hypothetical protein ASB1_08520 [Helicobacter heilmannii]GMB94678.1 hypothetical protein NHP21011_07710 [Helicobacter heilmannii]
MLRLVEHSTGNTAQAISSLVAGTDKFFNQVSNNANISQDMNDSFNGFDAMANNPSHNIASL